MQDTTRGRAVPAVATTRDRLTAAARAARDRIGPVLGAVRDRVVPVAVAAKERLDPVLAATKRRLSPAARAAGRRLAPVAERLSPAFDRVREVASEIGEVAIGTAPHTEVVDDPVGELGAFFKLDELEAIEFGELPTLGAPVDSPEAAMPEPPRESWSLSTLDIDDEVDEDDEDPDGDAREDGVPAEAERETERTA